MDHPLMTTHQQFKRRGVALSTPPRQSGICLAHAAVLYLMGQTGGGKSLKYFCARERRVGVGAKEGCGRSFHATTGGSRKTYLVIPPIEESLRRHTKRVNQISAPDGILPGANGRRLMS